MSDKKKKPQKLKARLPRGFVDRSAEDIRASEAMIAKIAEVYERYGFDPVETPMFEYTDALGKFLPDSDRPNEGVFSLTDDDDQWMSLRYDLTAPLARHVAENFNEIQMPYRTYRAGWVFRNEKPGPGRFRQFMQFDADTVGAPGVQADAEMCMMLADVMEAVGIKRGDYVVRVNNRKVLDGVMEAIGLGGDENSGRRLGVLRALDKLDRLGSEEVSKLLGSGRQDESGDWMEGLKLSKLQLDGLGWLITCQAAFTSGKGVEEFSRLERDIVDRDGFVGIDYSLNKERLDHSEDEGEDYSINSVLMLMNILMAFEIFPVFDGGKIIGANKKSGELSEEEKKLTKSVFETTALLSMVQQAGFNEDRVKFDLTCVRGLEYYTGPVYECELTFPVVNEKGQEVVFGSVAGGGRYDGLVSRFRGEPVPATGFSIGVSRLMTALKNLGKLDASVSVAPVLVTVMDGEAMGEYQRFTQQLREGGIRAEMYQGNWKKFGNQLKYADRRGCPVAVIQGSDERANGKIQIKDLIEGRKQADAIASNEEWRETRPGQFEIDAGDLVSEVKRLLAEQAGGDA